MAWDPAPSSWISTWSEDATDVTFTMATLTEELTAAEADATTGDWRDCLFSILKHSYDYYNGLATADKPTKLTMSQSASVDTNDELVYTFQIRFYTDISGQDVASET